MNNLYSSIKKTGVALVCSMSCMFLLNSCSSKEELFTVRALPHSGPSATGPYLTSDHQGNSVLCWTEQDGKDSLYRLKYAVYDHLTDTLGATFTVPGSAGCSTAAESMGKVGFKSDGTVMAIFAKPFPKEKNPFAGAIYYSMSANAGQTWTDPRFLHSDTAHVYGRNFFDLERLKDGQLAAIWLDGRFAKQIKGSSLFFSKTEKGKGFETDTCLDKGTCECCRTDILKDDQGNIHLAYRGIQYPSALSGRQVRDMVYMSSTDNGATFSGPKPLSADNWEINGCPHSGPSLAVHHSQVHAIWFTAGGGSGLYSTTRSGTSEFKKRQLVSSSGRHPQMIALPDGRTVMTFEEPAEAAAGENHRHEEMDHSKTDHSKMDHSKMGHHMPNTSTAAASRIVLRICSKNGETEKEINITDGQHADHHAVLRVVDHALLIAWVREGTSGSAVYYASMHLGDKN